MYLWYKQSKPDENMNRGHFHACRTYTHTNLYEMKRVLGALQVLQLTASLLQFTDFLPELFEKLLPLFLNCFLLLLDLLDEQSLVSLNNAYHHGEDLNTCLYHTFFIYLQISINQC